MSNGRGSGRGRGGAYYKNRYANKQPRLDSRYSGPPSEHNSPESQSLTAPRSWDDLGRDLDSIDGQQYGAYKRLLGQYHHDLFVLSIDHVQGDAYAPPSRVRAVMKWANTGLPVKCLDSDVHKTALCDFVTRTAAHFIRSKHLDRDAAGNGGWAGPKGGAFNINAPGQEVLPRTSAIISGSETIELRFTVNLPAAGRHCLGRQAHQILAVNLVELVRRTLQYENNDQSALDAHVLSVCNQHQLRQHLSERGLISFIANGSIMPRSSGAGAKPMTGDDLVAFESPRDLEVAMHLVDGTEVRGMGIPRGVTVLTGGGFHGKSTLVQAVELGVYNHIPGDGRELVVTSATAVKIRAEDGRVVTGTDISPFLTNLPGGKRTTSFSTENASGSTSMAANISEALEVGCRTLLIDEDSSATNLLVRDHRMQLLIKHEPITPLISNVRALYKDHGVSTIVVIGGLGDWLAVADRVIAMDSYTPHVVTDEAREIIRLHPSKVIVNDRYGVLPRRVLQMREARGFAHWKATKTYIPLRSDGQNDVPDPAQAPTGVDLQHIDQLVEHGQAKYIATCLERFAKATMSKGVNLKAWMEQLETEVSVDRCMPNTLDGGDYVAARRFEVAMALSRVHGLVAS